MKNQIKETDIALITVEKVDYSFKNIHCFYVARMIQLPSNNPTTRVYKIRTDLADYKTINIENTLTNGTIVLDQKLQLVVVEERQEWVRKEFSLTQINQFGEMLKPLIPDGLSETDLEKFKLSQMFLMKRQQDAPWDISAKKWRLLTHEDLIKDIPNA
ncbi:hypothetical protein PL373_09640 [Tenacibaculum maritimum]|nr:hypothetical protein [Tenacibaculum maritimum]MDB0601062.1 hypothetical protein [Tenacibaculum maritimum]MDB0601408.1 hypothetical protein [Tenacibaculum maritimum]MDB0611826.1 hypothetical protein [Tenacibaculum maritimum]MDB0612143.1 hypothetical protein [Tenacibaculum maritimum]